MGTLWEFALAICTESQRILVFFLVLRWKVTLLGMNESHGQTFIRHQWGNKPSYAEYYAITIPIRYDVRNWLNMLLVLESYMRINEYIKYQMV